MPFESAMSSTNPLVSILILNHNGKLFLKDCFESVLASHYPNFEVILIDNASTDDSVEYTHAEFPQVEVFETGINGGYSMAYNLSFEKAKGQYYVLLNNDVTVEPDWLDPMVQAAENDERIGALQPKLVSMLDPSNFEYAGASGGFMDIYGFPFLRGRVFGHLEKDEGQYDDETPIFWTTGAAMFLRKEALNYTGGLDEEFVHHMEEIDLCWRLNLVGYQLKVIPAAKIYHYGGATITPDSYKKIYWNHRNSLFMLLKNLDNSNLPKVLLGRWVLDILAIGRALMTADFKRAHAIIAGHNWLLLRWGHIRQKRKAVQHLRKVSDREIFKLFYPKSIALQFFLKGRKTYHSLMKAIGQKQLG